MSQAQPSDGQVNQLFSIMVRQGFNNYTRLAIDNALVESKLKQCKYETLVAIQNAYILAFKDKSWPVHAQIIIKAEQSSKWRAWRDKNTRGGSTTSPIIDDGTDPLAELMSNG